nr:hypothetical protein [Tanacetum cinerariifolium]
MELYMLNRQHVRMILESVEHGPLLWPTVEEDGVTRLKKYSKLSAAKAIQADCDVKATNIILQALPPTHKVAKDLWERIQMLMQGTSLTKQDRECKLYDAFDKFAYQKGETLRDFYLRFSLLLNDMNMYNMKLEQFQVNTKFLNTLPPEWSKFVTDVKLVRDLHTTNVDQLHAYLANLSTSSTVLSPTSILATNINISDVSYATSYHTPQFVSQGPSSSTHLIFYPVTDTSLLVNHNAYMASSSAPQINYALKVQQSSKYSSPKTGLVVPVFQKGDDPIDAINHMMSFLTTVVTLRYLATNNQLKTSSNPHCDEINSAKIALMANLSHYGSDNLAEVNNQDNRANYLTPEEMQVLSTSKQSTILTQSNTEIASDSNIISYSQYMNELERYRSQERVLNELKHDEKASTSYESYQEIESLKHTLSKHLKEKESLEQKITILKNDFQKEESRNIDRELALEIQVKELNNIVLKRSQSSQTVHMLTKTQVFYNHSTRQALGFQNPCYLKKAQQLKPKLYDGRIIEKSDVVVIPDTEETLMLAEESRSKMIKKQNDPQMTEKKIELSTEQAFWSQYLVQTDKPNLSTTTIVEVPKELLKVSMVNSCLKKLKSHLASFDMVVKERTTASAITEGTWGFEHTKACFRDDIIPFVKALKELFTSFDQYLIDEVTEVQNVFKQMELAIEQHPLTVDIVNVVVHDNVMSDCLNGNVCAHCVTIESELKKDFIKKECYETLLQQYHTLEKHFISLEVNNQLKKEIFQKNTLSSSKSAPNFVEFFKINKLKAQAQAKDTVILQLKEKLRSLKAHTDYIRHTQDEAATLREIVESERLLSPPNTSLDYASGSESRPPMLNKEKYVPWSSRILRYAKSRPNEKLIHNSILNGPYVRRMIPEPGDAERD